MLIQYITANSKCGYDSKSAVTIDGKIFLRFSENTASDSGGQYSFGDIHKIPNLIRKIKKAVDHGETLEIEEVEMTQEEFRKLKNK